MNKKTLFSWIFVFVGLAVIAIGSVCCCSWLEDLEFFNRISSAEIILIMTLFNALNFTFALKSMIFAPFYKGAGLKTVNVFSIIAFFAMLISFVLMMIKSATVNVAGGMGYEFIIISVGFPSLAMLVIRFFAWLIFGVIKPLRLKNKAIEGEE